jgi:hypothetical protein
VLREIRPINGHNAWVVDESLRGKLLIASPELEDYFRRSVILVLEHNDEGAMGVVLNRPSEAAVDDAVPALADLGDPGDLVHVGGPVQPQAVIALGEGGGVDRRNGPPRGSVSRRGPVALRARAQGRRVRAAGADAGRPVDELMPPAGAHGASRSTVQPPSERR